MFASREDCRRQNRLPFILLLFCLAPACLFAQSQTDAPAVPAQNQPIQDLPVPGSPVPDSPVQNPAAPNLNEQLLDGAVVPAPVGTEGGSVTPSEEIQPAGEAVSEVVVPAPAEASTDDVSVQVIRLDELSRVLQRKMEQRDELKQLLAGNEEEALIKERETYNNLNRDISRLSTTFESIALGNIDTSLLNDQDDAETDWRKDLLEILNPLIESLKSVTKRPRELAELRNSVYVSETRLSVAQQALESLEAIKLDALEAEAAAQITDLMSKWQDEEDQFDQERMVAQNQLERLTDDQETFFQGLWPATRVFILGRGLTLMLAFAAAVFSWALMRFLWWFYTTRFTTKDQRRNSTWYRLLEYSYYLLTSLIMVMVVLIVLYIREDLLLLALALLVIAGAALSFRQFLPRYIREARLLLNLGSVREDERVIYNGLPWQVMSLNLYSVLRNPALDGVIRLPLGVVATLVSRPVKNKLWFPSNRGDYVILPDNTFGQIKVQTPDLVEISVRGGMTMTYTTPDFYAINLINLSRDETFGIAVTFGFDYGLQSISLSEIPAKLEPAVRSALDEKGYGKHLTNLIVELSSANTSSLDFLIFATFSSKVASDFFKLQRAIQQTCVAVSNENDWTIPFPQLTIHQGK